MKKQLKGIIILFIAAFIWGSSFVAQAEGTDIGPFTFNGIRMLMGSAALIPVIVVKDMLAKKKGGFDNAAYKKEALKSAKGGAIMGVVLFAASTLQQMAFYNDSTPGKIAFITAFYMFLVPIFGLVFKKKPAPLVWVSVVIGIVGLYFLCIGPQGIDAVSFGDILAFGCAICYAVHILTIERVVDGTDAVKISSIQFFVTGVISCVMMFIFEKPEISAINSCIIPLLYSGLLSSAIAYTFQIIGQKYAEPTVASLVMCTESVFGVLSACVFYRTLPEWWETVGCIIMFAAIVLSQLADFRPKKKKSATEA